MKDSKIHPNSFIDDAINAEIKRLTRQETTMELIILHVMSDLPSNPRSGETTNFINENSKCQGDVNKVIRHQYIKRSLFFGSVTMDFVKRSQSRVYQGHFLDNVF